MHHEFRVLADQVDTGKGRGLFDYQIDTLLNMAQRTLVRSIAVPRFAEQASKFLGYQGVQRSREDIKNIVVDNYPIIPTKKNGYSYAELPENYMAHEASYATVPGCSKKSRCFVIQTDDLNEEDPFSRSDPKWKEINIDFVEGHLVKIFYPNVSKYEITYVRNPKYICIGGYPDFDDTEKVKSECELSDIIHDDIVSVASLIFAASLNSASYSTKLNEITRKGL